MNNRLPNYKYRLLELFICQFGAGYSKKFREFADEQKISNQLVWLDRDIRANETRIIPPWRLSAYAEFLQCDRAELRNHVTNQTTIQ